MYLEMFLNNVVWFGICWGANQIFDLAIGIRTQPKLNAVIALISILIGSLLSRD
jgi:hypothetical protein